MSRMFDVIVVGGGIVGLSAAIAMSQRGFTVAVVDAGALFINKNRPNLRVYAINPDSQALFQELGVWQYLDKSRLSTYRHMRVWDAANGAKIEFDSRMVGADRLGYMIEESVIKEALLQLADNCGVHFFPESRISDVKTTMDEVELKCGETKWQAKLLIVADGADSGTRKLLGVSVVSWPYHQHAIVATVQTEKSHQHTAYQVFNKDGPLAFLPLKDVNHCSIVWSTAPAKAKALMTLSKDAFSQQLTEAFASTLGRNEVISSRHYFPLHMSHTNQYVGKNWLLMGDAAHRIHPLAGLGLNIGLADVNAWLAKIDVTKNLSQMSKALGAYQRERKHAVWQVIAVMSGLKSLFANPLPPIVAIRGLGLNICNNIPTLKRFFIAQA